MLIFHSLVQRARLVAAFSSGVTGSWCRRVARHADTLNPPPNVEPARSFVKTLQGLGAPYLKKRRVYFTFKEI